MKENEKSNDYIRLGDIMHQLFSTIGNVNDIDTKLMEFELNGIIGNKSVTKEQVVAQVKKAFSNNKAKDWFRPGWKLMNECNILFTDPISGKVKTERPDRVMIDGKKAVVVDFKFGIPKPFHEQQVRDYMSLLRKMGYEQVEGNVWYVFMDRIMQVRLF